MQFLNDIILGFIPEFIIVLTILANSIIMMLYPKNKPVLTFVVSLGGLILALIGLGLTPILNFQVTFFGNFVSDGMGIFFSALILLGSILTLLASKKYLTLSSNYHGEYYSLILCATLGAMLLCGASDLVMLFVALETLSIPCYILAGFTRDDKLSSEGSMKYLIMGAFVSALLLYGMSFLYGVTAQTNLLLIALSIANSSVTPVLLLSILLILGAVFFKTSLFPFHMWTPDVYSSAPVPITAFLSTVPKIAAFCLLIKLMIFFSKASLLIIGVLYIVSILTMFIGNLGAIKQTNLRKLMAYSTIAQAGYVVAGVSLFSYLGFSAVMFYLFGYLFMNFGAWVLIEMFINKTRKDEINDIEGLAYSNPKTAFLLAVCLISLAGLPVTIGFWGKLYLFQAILFAGKQYWLLLFTALINTIIGLFYYVKVIKSMYVKPVNREVLKLNYLEDSMMLKTAVMFCLIFVILVGFAPSPFINATQGIAKQQNTSYNNFLKVITKNIVDNNSKQNQN